MYSSSLLTIPQGMILNLLLVLLLSLVVFFSFKIFKKNIAFKKLVKKFSVILIPPYLVIKIGYYILGITGNLGQLYILPMIHLLLIIIIAAIVFTRNKKLTTRVN